MSKPSSTAGAKQIFIVDDHPVFREGLGQVLDTCDGLTVCGEAGSAEEALEKIGELHPDVVVVDLTLPGKSGLELIKDLRAKSKDLKLLVVSMHDEALYADRVLRAGGDGYIMKQEDPEEILNAVQDVLSGHIYVSEKVLADLRKAESPQARPEQPATSLVSRLTDAELEILELLGLGKTDEEIAQERNQRPAEVTSLCAGIQKKLGLKSPNALIRFAVCWVEQGKSERNANG